MHSIFSPSIFVLTLTLTFALIATVGAAPAPLQPPAEAASSLPNLWAVPKLVPIPDEPAAPEAKPADAVKPTKTDKPDKLDKPAEPVKAAEAKAVVANVSVPAPTAEQFSKICAKTEDPSDCGKRVEAEQIKRAPSLVKRDGSLLAVLVDDEPPFLFEDKPGEAGPSTSFFAYYAAADAVVLYRARADKVEFVLVHRPSHSVTDLPNEPIFNTEGRQFATADFCAEGCENRLGLWRFERRGPVRAQSFAPRTVWSDAGVSWDASKRLIVDFTENGKAQTMNLELKDPRWTVLLP